MTDSHALGPVPCSSRSATYSRMGSESTLFHAAINRLSPKVHNHRLLHSPTWGSTITATSSHFLTSTMFKLVSMDAMCSRKPLTSSFPSTQLDSNEYWPGGTSVKQHNDAVDEFIKKMGELAILCFHVQTDIWLVDPIVKFLETAAFAIPEAGVLVSAGIGLLWGAIQPGAMHNYQVCCSCILLPHCHFVDSGNLGTYAEHDCRHLRVQARFC